METGYTDYQTQIDEQVEGIETQIDNKAEYCKKWEDVPVGHKYTDGHGDMYNYSELMLDAQSANVIRTVFRDFYKAENGVTKDSCREADCLHPCYGASHEQYCTTCWSLVRSNGLDKSVWPESHLAVCDLCLIPAEDIDLSAYDITYEEYVIKAQGEPLFTEAEDYFDYLGEKNEDLMTLEEYVEVAQGGVPMYANEAEWALASFGQPIMTKEQYAEYAYGYPYCDN